MNISIERSFEISEGVESAARCLGYWSLKYGYTCTRDSGGEWEFIRGSQLQALYSFDIRKTPTTIKVSITDSEPATAHCSIQVKSWLQWSTGADPKRVGEQMDLLQAYLNGVFKT
jgi:hypothetical protein